MNHRRGSRRTSYTARVDVTRRTQQGTASNRVVAGGFKPPNELVGPTTGSSSSGLPPSRSAGLNGNLADGCSRSRDRARAGRRPPGRRPTLLRRSRPGHGLPRDLREPRGAPPIRRRQAGAYRASRQARRVPAKPDPSKPSTTVCFSSCAMRARMERPNARLRRPDRSVDDACDADRTSSLDRARAGSPPIAPSNRSLARAPRPRPAAWKSQPRDVSSPLCGGDVTPSPRPPRARVPLTPIIADREPHPVSPTNRPPCPPSWASRSPRRCPGERPARPNPQDAFVTPVQSVKRQLYPTFSTVNLASRLWTDRSPRLNPTRHFTGSAAFDPRPPRRPQGPPPSSTSPRGSPTRAARLT